MARRAIDDRNALSVVPFQSLPIASHLVETDMSLEQAVIAVLIGYNAAETEAGATLDAAPSMPSLGPDELLAARCAE